MVLITIEKCKVMSFSPNMEGVGKMELQISEADFEQLGIKQAASSEREEVQERGQLTEGMKRAFKWHGMQGPNGELVTEKKI